MQCSQCNIIFVKYTFIDSASNIVYETDKDDQNLEPTILFKNNVNQFSKQLFVKPNLVTSIIYKRFDTAQLLYHSANLTLSNNISKSN